MGQSEQTRRLNASIDRLCRAPSGMVVQDIIFGAHIGPTSEAKREEAARLWVEKMREKGLTTDQRALGRESVHQDAAEALHAQQGEIQG